MWTDLQLVLEAETMRSQFPGHFRPTKEGFKELWSQAIFAFDTSVLLNLYEYSSHARDSLLSAIEGLGEQAWIPHQVGLEFFEGRLNVIEKQQAAYTDTVARLNDILKHIEDVKSHPFLPDSVVEKFKSLITEIAKEFKPNQDDLAKRYTDDDILDRLATIYEGRTGTPLPVEIQADVEKNGPERLGKKIPPGFKDKKLGDLIIWKQIIEKAKATQKSVILIIDDVKEDWWLRKGGKKIGARPELVQEFHQETCGLIFYMYNSPRFAEHQKLESGVVDEVRGVSERQAVEKIHHKSLVETIDDMIRYKLINNDAAKTFAGRPRSAEWIPVSTRIADSPLAEALFRPVPASLLKPKVDLILGAFAERRIDLTTASDALTNFAMSRRLEELGLPSIQPRGDNTGGSSLPHPETDD